MMIICRSISHCKKCFPISTRYQDTVNFHTDSQDKLEIVSTCRCNYCSRTCVAGAAAGAAAPLPSPRPLPHRRRRGAVADAAAPVTSGRTRIFAQWLRGRKITNFRWYLANEASEIYENNFALNIIAIWYIRCCCWVESAIGEEVSKSPRCYFLDFLQCERQI